MRRLTGTEKAGVALAIVFVMGGLCIMVHPIDMVVLHPGDSRYSGSRGMASEHVSKELARYLGGGAILMGVAFAAFVLCRSRE